MQAEEATLTKLWEPRTFNRQFITIASSKGGAGKTTIARLLLGHAVRNGLTAAALDADLNHSLTDSVGRAGKPVEKRFCSVHSRARACRRAG